jgi:hypothetical protein
MYREVFELKRDHAKALADTYDSYREQMQTVLKERLPQYTVATLAAVTAWPAAAAAGLPGQNT